MRSKRLAEQGDGSIVSSGATDGSTASAGATDGTTVSAGVTDGLLKVMELSVICHVNQWGWINGDLKMILIIQQYWSFGKGCGQL